MYPGAKFTGFYHASVTKGLFVLSGTASLINVFLASSTRKIVSSIPWSIALARSSKLLQALFSSFYYSNTKDLLCGSVLLYCFRVFERRYGSSKYASYIFATSLLAVGLQLVVSFALKQCGQDVGILPAPALYGLLYATLVQYFCDVQAADVVTFIGFPLSGKIIVYSVAFQMLSTSKGSMVAGLCGMVAGILYRFNIGYVQQWLKLPSFLVRVVSSSVGRFFQSSAPTLQPYAQGATLDIQRQQQMEWYEQQVWRARTTNVHQRGSHRVGQGYADVLIPPVGEGWLWGAGQADNHVLAAADGHNAHDNNANAPQQPTVEVSEDQVQTLVEMGFSRVAVLHALTATNNDMNMATNILLSKAA